MRRDVLSVRPFVFTSVKCLKFLPRRERDAGAESRHNFSAAPCRGGARFRLTTTQQQHTRSIIIIIIIVKRGTMLLMLLFC
eukprot:scaffold7518_cov150-Amphora_coffeaeformis.AAC.5